MKPVNGRLKQWWSIKGIEFSGFEVIGNNQKGADLIGWYCSEYDADGNYVKPLGIGEYCKDFFKLVLNNLVIGSDVLVVEPLKKAVKVHPESAIKIIGDFSFETDGTYYFVRRLSRMLIY